MIAVSYDPPGTLRAFADANGIGYQLLSDEGSRLITALGLLDRDLEDHHAAFGMPTGDQQRGVAYPALFVLDEDGRVGQKRIQPNYRARESGPLLLEEALVLPPGLRGAGQERVEPRVRLRLVADGAGYVRWQRTRLHVELLVEDGWHVYANPVPPGYAGLTVAVQPLDEMEVGEPAFPAPHAFRVAGLDEEFLAYQGDVVATVPVAFNVGKDNGPVTVTVVASYQACNDRSCLPPATTNLEITLPEITLA